MARSRDVQESLSRSLGLEMKRVAEVTARIRPHGYFAAETKSKLSHNRVNARHAANLLYALMTEVAANSTPDVLKEAEKIHRCNVEHPKSVLEILDIGFEGLASRLTYPHYLVDGIELVINMAKANPSLFSYLFVEGSEGFFEISNYHFCNFILPVNWPRMNYLTGNGEISGEALHASGKPIEEFIKIEYEGDNGAPKMEKITRITLEPFLGVGRILAGHDTIEADRIVANIFAEVLEQSLIDDNEGGDDA